MDPQAVKRKEQTMLTHPTERRLVALGLTGMAKALEEQRDSPTSPRSPSRSGSPCMVDREAIERENKRLVSRLKFASLRQIGRRRGRRHEGAARSRQGAVRQARRRRLDRTAPELARSSARPASAKVGSPARSATRPAATIAPSSIIACHGCSMPWRSHAATAAMRRLLKSLARVELLILDDWGLATLTPEQGRDLLEIVDDRHGRGSTIVTSQLPVDHWHEVIANPTIADAILDRLVHNAHRLTLKGESMRKTAAKRAGLDASSRTHDPMKPCDGSQLSAFTGMLSAFNRNPWPRSSESALTGKPVHVCRLSPARTRGFFVRRFRTLCNPPPAAPLMRRGLLITFAEWLQPLRRP